MITIINKNKKYLIPFATMKKNIKKKILIVAMVNSIHTVRWVSQFLDQDYDIRIFPSQILSPIHPAMRGVTIYNYLYCKYFGVEVRQKGIFIYPITLIKLLIRIIRIVRHDYYEKYLLKIIKKFNPDIVHSLETQNAGYLVLKAKEKNTQGYFPIWIHTNWGSDIYLFGKLKNHVKRIKDVLKNCDYYSCECNRDVVLAEKFGLEGKVLPVIPNAGGYDLEQIKQLRNDQPTSERKLIMLKGNQGWAGRALVGIRALTRAGDLLKGFTVIIYSNPNGEDIKIASELFSFETGIDVQILSGDIPHREILTYHGMARISIGLSISDAISTSVLEAMVMGSFPIQSWTSAADEWIEDGRSGILVPPEDPEVIEQAIRKALVDDKLVDEAARINWDIAKKRLDYEVVKAQAIYMYNSVFKY